MVADDAADDALDADQQVKLDAAAAAEAVDDQVDVDQTARIAELEAEAAADDQRDVQQQAVIDRLEELVEQLVKDDEPDDPPPPPLPMALQRPLFGHMPIKLEGLRPSELEMVNDLRARKVEGAHDGKDKTQSEYVTRLEQAHVFEMRLDEGLITGWFMYSDANTLPAFDPAWAHLRDMWLAGKRFVIEYSPRKVTDPALAAVYSGLPVDQRPWLWLGYWQEPEGDFGLEKKPPFSAYRDGVRTCAAVAHRYGALNGTHLQTGWDLSAGNNQPWGNTEYLDGLLEGLDGTVVDFCSESAFNFTAALVLDDLVRTAVPYLRQRFPGVRIMFTAVGSSPAPGTPITDATCRRGVMAVDDAYDQAVELDVATAFGHYCTGWHDGLYYGPGHPNDTVTEPMLRETREDLQRVA